MIKQRLLDNRRERVVQLKYLEEGWEVYHRGWPDFIMIRGDEVKFVEVKKMPKRRRSERVQARQGLQSVQFRLKQILEKFAPYEIVNLP